MAVAGDLSELNRLLPGHEAVFEGVALRCGRIFESLPSVMRHGDLWAKNLLVRRGRLTGVIDWDTWHPSSPPGVDALHLYLSAGFKRRSIDPAQVWKERPWLQHRFLAMTDAYWKGLGLRPTSDQLEAIAIAWWAGLTSRALARHPRKADDPAWLSQNISSVVSALEASSGTT